MAPKLSPYADAPMLQRWRDSRDQLGSARFGSGRHIAQMQNQVDGNLATQYADCEGNENNAAEALRHP